MCDDNYKTCNHTVGLTAITANYKLVNIGELINIAYFEYSHATTGHPLDSYNLYDKQVIKSSGEILTRGYFLRRFKHCPECGEKLNWKNLMSAFRTEMCYKINGDSK